MGAATAEVSPGQRRRVLRALAAAGLMTGGMPGIRAQAKTGFPSRPITIIVPATAGGLLDVYQRFVDRLATPHLNNQTIVIENKPGNNLLFGADAMARLEQGDGYTLTQALQIQARMPHIQKVRYDFHKDFTWIICMVTSPFGIAVRTESPFKTFNDLVTAAKARPGEISFGTVGFANAGHLLMEDVQRKLGVKFNLIAMKGSSDVIQGTLGGHLDFMSDSASWAPQVQAGRMRLLVTFGDERLAKYRDVPTATELGLPIVYTSPIGLAGPKNMDPAVTRILHDAYKRAIDMPEHRAILDKFELIPAYRNSADFARYMDESFVSEKKLLAGLDLTGRQ